MCCNFNDLHDKLIERCTEWGSGGREFKSHRPDHKNQEKEWVSLNAARSFFWDLGAILGFV